MDALKEEALQKQTVQLVNNMNPTLLAPYLFAKKLLNDDELERVGLLINTTRDKNLFIIQVRE